MSAASFIALVGATAGVDYARALASSFGLSYDELPPEEQAFWLDAARIYLASGIVPMPDTRSYSSALHADAEAASTEESAPPEI
jgi:hypothetical protein